MPELFCGSCGRRIYTVAPLESLSGDEVRCPRCGGRFAAERRQADRRRRVAIDDPGPPSGRDRRKTGRRRER
jgi:DNA-directed RNA polymerase subunit RPC12/RpoP